MSGGGDDEANQLLQQEINQRHIEEQQKLKALAKTRMSIIKGQSAQQFTNPDNPNPPMQIIQ